MFVSVHLSMHTQVFESKSSSVWTGAWGTSLDAIENAEQHEIESIPFDIQIWLKSKPTCACLGIQSLAQDGLYLVPTRQVDGAHYQELHSIVLPIDALSCFAMYSPSPFVSTVLVVLDVDKKQQQGYFFGRLRRAVLRSASTEQMQQLLHDQDNSSDTDVAEEFLAALHSAFPAVKLSSSAKKCVAKQELGRHVAKTNLVGRIKRRKTLSADAFYGSNAVTRVITDPSDGFKSDKSWQELYKKLQFRVLHSITCQLEGTAALSLSFPRQQEAFEFADQVAAFRRRDKSPRGVGSPKTGYNTIDHAPRVFAFESAGHGKRRFLVTNLAKFWKNYTKTRADQRHVYEIIREGVPCRLYLDLEFKRAINPHVDGNALVTRLLSLIQLQFYRRYGICVRHQDIHQLESSTPAKFSRHVIFHLPGGDLFTNNLHVGAFVHELIHDLLVLNSDEDLEKDGRSRRHSPFLINTETENDFVDKQQLFIDTGVYTRNRMFRMLGSSKFKKQAVLRLLNASSSSFTDWDKELFVRTLVCPYQSTDAARLSQQTKPFRLLRCEPSPAVVGCSRRSTNLLAKSFDAASVECRRSIYPALDDFILSKATTGGVQGEIRAVQMLLTTSSDMPAVLPGKGSHREQPAVNTVSRPWMIIYHMTRNRWCANIRRPHKSNNIMFIVNLDQRVFYQKCHDSTCQSMDFRSPTQPLPSYIDFDAEAVEPSSVDTTPNSSNRTR